MAKTRSVVWTRRGETSLLLDAVADALKSAQGEVWEYDKLNNILKLKLGGVDHGVLAGLLDDDHTQYSRVDGTRAFTGVVSGVTPTLSSHLVTKAYADALILSKAFAFFMS